MASTTQPETPSNRDLPPHFLPTYLYKLPLVNGKHPKRITNNKVPAPQKTTKKIVDVKGYNRWMNDDYNKQDMDDMVYSPNMNSFKKDVNTFGTLQPRQCSGCHSYRILPRFSTA